MNAPVCARRCLSGEQSNNGNGVLRASVSCFRGRFTPRHHDLWDWPSTDTKTLEIGGIPIIDNDDDNIDGPRY
jgi:hypothetical protein